MSQKVAKKDRKGKPKAERKPAGIQVPKVNPNRQRATVQQLNNAVNFLFQQAQDLDKRVGTTIRQVWKNQEELKGGLDASEYNLRSHQKVLNAMAMDLETLVKAVAKLMEAKDEHFKEDTFVLQMADVTLPTEEGKEPQVVRRINWSYYHGEVEKDLKVLAEIEKVRLEQEEAKEKAKKLEEAVWAVAEKAKASGNDPAEVEAAAKELLEKTQRLADELGKAMKGEPYDASVIEEAEKFIAESEAKEGPTEPLAEQNSAPEGAAVFGG